MKITNLLPMVILSILLVGAVSCTTMQPLGDDEYETVTDSRQQPPSRIYVEDPYRPGRTIVMDRDPFTGKYYQVQSYSRYDNRYDSRYYGNNYPGDRYNSNRDVYRRQPQQTAPSREQIQQNEQKRQDAADVMSGKRQ